MIQRKKKNNLELVVIDTTASSPAPPPPVVHVTESIPFLDIKLENEILRHIIYDDTALNKLESDEVTRNIGYVTNTGISKNYFQSDFKQWLFDRIIEHYNKFSECAGKSIVNEYIKNEYENNGYVEKIATIDKILTIQFRLNYIKPIVDKLRNKHNYKRIHYLTKDVINLLDQANSLNQDDSVSVARKISEESGSILIASDKYRIIEEDVFHSLEKDLLEIKDRKANPEKYRGIRSGYDSIDAITGGWKPGELITVLGRPGTGKSVLLLNFAFNAWQDRANVIYVTIEMPIEQQRNRFYSRLLGTSYSKFRSPERFEEDEIRMVEDDLRNHKERMLKISNKFWFIDAPENCSASFIESRIISFENTTCKKADMLIIDPIYLLKPSNPKSDDPVGTVSWDLKLLARKLNIPVLCASQFNREGGKRHQKQQTASTMDAAFSDKLSNNSDTMIGILSDPEKTDKAVLQFPKTRDSEKPKHLNFLTEFSIMRWTEELKIEESPDNIPSNPDYLPYNEERKKENEVITKPMFCDLLLSTGQFRIDIPLELQREKYKKGDFELFNLAENRIMIIEVEHRGESSWKGDTILRFSTLTVPQRKDECEAEWYIAVSSDYHRCAIIPMEEVKKCNIIKKNTTVDKNTDRNPVKTEDEKFFDVPKSSLMFMVLRDGIWEPESEESPFWYVGAFPETIRDFCFGRVVNENTSNVGQNQAIENMGKAMDELYQDEQPKKLIRRKGSVPF